MDEAKPAVMAEVIEYFEELRSYAHANMPSSWINDEQEARIDAALASLAHKSRPLGVEREVVARIIDPEAFRRKDETMAGRNPGWGIEDVQADCLRAMEKAAIIAALTLTDASDEGREALNWAVGRWQAEVANRPLVNVHRRSLDDAWRQMVRHFGGDDEALLGPSHDELLRAVPPSDSSGDSA